jgi:LPS sulfotransferase NodH
MSSKPKICYVICGGQEAGGAALARALATCRGSVAAIEYSNAAKDGKLESTATNDLEYLKKLIASGCNNDTIFGLQIAWQEVARIEQEHLGGLHRLLQFALDNVQYIWIRRRNKIAQGIAASAIHLDGPVAQPDWPLIENSVQRAEVFDAQWIMYFKRNRARVLQVIYEDFVRDPNDTLRSISNYLNCPFELGSASAALVLQEPKSHLNDLEERYRERKAGLDDNASASSRENEPTADAQFTSGDHSPAPVAHLSVLNNKPELQRPMDPNALPRIFVPIPSYRDTECQWTIKDLFDKAKHPDRIFVGVCWQTVPEQDGDCFRVKTRPEQCRELNFHVRESKGTCWARQRAESLWSGEEYFFQIDAHNRFVQDWDEKLITMLATCPSARAILSTYAVPYEPPDKLAGGGYVRIHPQDFSEDGRLRIRTTTTPIATAPKIPEPSAFMTGHFLFGPSQLIHEVPHDPYIYVNAEDNTWGPRLWTAGWDFFVPNEVLGYHDFTNRRVKHWDDHRDWKSLQSLSAKRIRHLYRTEVCDDPEALRDFERYDLGTRRTLSEYEAFADIDFKRRLVNGKTYEEIAMGVPAEKRRARTKEIFRRQWQESQTGPKPKHRPKPPPPPASDTTQRELKRVLEILGIQILADAGCGDCSWMRNISPSLQLYMGFDIIDELVTKLRSQQDRPSNHFFNTADITIDMMPKCDAIVCRDVLTRLPLPYVKAALNLFKASGSRYLISTTCAQERNWRIELEQSQDLSLSIAPFNLPPPLLFIGDPPDSKRGLGVWSLKEIPDFDVRRSTADVVRTMDVPPRAAKKASLDNLTYGFEFSGKQVKPAAYGRDYVSELCRILDTYVGGKAQSVLEWGTGLTTQILAEYGQRVWNTELLLTIDHSQTYQNAVFANRSKPSFVMLKCLDRVGPTRSNSDQELNYSTFPLSLKKTFDIILIDGRRRMECAFIAATLCHEKTLVILHDYRRARYQPVLALFDVVEDGAQFRVLRIKSTALQALKS